jgi:MFS family permease
VSVRGADPPLWRNRDFVVLLTGQLLSSAGTQLTSIAYPLLVLAVTGSPAKAGAVAFARLLPFAGLGLLAGVAADRWNRKVLMIGADAVRAVAVAGLGAAILFDLLAFWQVAIVAFVEGACGTVFVAAQPGALRAVVPKTQLPAAVAAQRARISAVSIVGPPIGGALFQVGRALPFVADAASYAFSTFSMLMVRTPFQEPRVRDTARLRAQLTEGFRFLWNQPFLRTSAFLYGIGNVTIPAVLFVIVVVGQRQGLAGGEIGALLAVFSVFTLLGSLVSPLFRRALSVRAILLLEFWTGLGSVLFLVWPNVYVLTAAILPQAISLPITDSVVDGFRIAITPDRLLGRVESVRISISLLIAPLGPLLAGFLLDSFSARVTIACSLTLTLTLALWGTFSSVLRNAPRLDELNDIASRQLDVPASHA